MTSHFPVNYLNLRFGKLLIISRAYFHPPPRVIQVLNFLTTCLKIFLRNIKITSKLEVPFSEIWADVTFQTCLLDGKKSEKKIMVGGMRNETDGPDFKKPPEVQLKNYTSLCIGIQDTFSTQKLSWVETLEVTRKILIIKITKILYENWRSSLARVWLSQQNLILTSDVRVSLSLRKFLSVNFLLHRLVQRKVDEIFQTLNILLFHLNQTPKKINKIILT